MWKTGTIVLVQFVSFGTETDVGTIWKVFAEMFTASISVATAIGRQTNCGKQKRKSGKSLGETCDFSWVQTSDLCDNYVHGIWADICRHRCQPIECRWLRSYREMKGSGPQLRKGGTPSKRTSEDASRGNIVFILPVYDLQNASCNYRK